MISILKFATSGKIYSKGMAKYKKLCWIKNIVIDKNTIVGIHIFDIIMAKEI